jgi:hydroxysqualene synthase
MTSVDELQTGKGHRDENFPVASFIIRARHRPAIMAFYRFVRAADDVADNASAPASDKLRLLDNLHRSLVGETDDVPQGVALRAALAERGLSSRHAEDLLEAFHRDVTKLRYDDWDDLVGYCRYSAMPVGRFVLDVHGEARGLWPMNDALCTALQIINHLQDCASDYKELDRVYVPLDTLEAAGLGVEALRAPRASAALKSVISGLATRCGTLLDQSRPFAASIADRRLGLEVSVIQRLGEDLVGRLERNDPLCERVHHDRIEALGLAGAAAARFIADRLGAKRASRTAVSAR